MLRIEKKLDSAFQKLAKGKKCYYCSHSASEIHHIIRRANPLYRYDKRNALPVCRKHHFDIHQNGLEEPTILFKQEDIREYLNRNFICYRQFLERKAKEYDIKYTEKDFEKVVSAKKKPDARFFRTTEFYKKVMEFKRKQRKEAYRKKKEYNAKN